MMKILGSMLFAVLLIILAVCTLRALRLGKRANRPAQPRSEPVPTDLQYGEKLGAMLRCETVSHREQTELAKFYAFHDTLETLFPAIHAVCEKHVFDGSLLFRWKGRRQDEAVLYMSHHDVVEAQGEWTYPPFSGQIAQGAVWAEVL